MNVNREYSDHPIIGVGVVLVHEKQVLLVKRGKSPRKGEWSIPGGKQELGETLKETACREIFEETGLEIKNLQLLDVLDSIILDSQKRIRYHYSLIDWSAEYSSGELNPGGDVTDARWFSMNQIIEMDVWEKSIEIIKKALLLFD